MNVFDHQSLTHSLTFFCLPYINQRFQLVTHLFRQSRCNFVHILAYNSYTYMWTYCQYFVLYFGSYWSIWILIFLSCLFPYLSINSLLWTVSLVTINARAAYRLLTRVLFFLYFNKFILTKKIYFHTQKTKSFIWWRIFYIIRPVIGWSVR